jgi:hypothetical protein
MKKTTKLEAILWSVAFPGFGQMSPYKRNYVYLELFYEIKVPTNLNHVSTSRGRTV